VESGVQEDNLLAVIILLLLLQLNRPLNILQGAELGDFDDEVTGLFRDLTIEKANIIIVIRPICSGHLKKRQRSCTVCSLSSSICRIM